MPEVQKGWCALLEAGGAHYLKKQRRRRRRASGKKVGGKGWRNRAVERMARVADGRIPTH